MPSPLSGLNDKERAALVFVASRPSTRPKDLDSRESNVFFSSPVDGTRLDEAYDLLVELSGLGLVVEYPYLGLWRATDAGRDLAARFAR